MLYHYEGNQEEAAQNDVLMAEKSVVGVVNILVDSYGRNIPLATDS